MECIRFISSVNIECHNENYFTTSVVNAQSIVIRMGPGLNIEPSYLLTRHGAFAEWLIETAKLSMAELLCYGTFSYNNILGERSTLYRYLCIERVRSKHAQIDDRTVAISQTLFHLAIELYLGFF
ncbi:hypothetical protein ACJX0J_009176, partial [Zea mays]